MIDESGTYDSFDDFLDEFFPDDPADRESIERGAERLAAEERGARLVELRERSRATREDVALRMGVALQRVIDLESGTVGFDFRRIHGVAGTAPAEADDDLRELVRYLAELSAYVQAIGGDIQLELPGTTLDLADVKALRTLLRHQPVRLLVWAEVEGWRTDIAA